MDYRKCANMIIHLALRTEVPFQSSYVRDTTNESNNSHQVWIEFRVILKFGIEFLEFIVIIRNKLNCIYRTILSLIYKYQFSFAHI